MSVVSRIDPSASSATEAKLVQLRARVARIIGHVVPWERGAFRLARAVYYAPEHRRLAMRLGKVAASDGTVFRIDTHSFIEWCIYVLGDYEADVRGEMMRRLRPEGLFVDCGANIGVHACSIARRLREAQVIAIEPVTELADQLTINCQLNDVDNVTVCRTAAGESEGVIPIYLPKSDSGNFGQASLSPLDTLDREPRMVPIDTLDSIVRSRSTRRVDVLKIDVEGHELDVLRGASEILSRDKPAIFFEDKELRPRAQGDSSRRLSAIEIFFQQCGYSVRSRVGEMLIAEPVH